jgi:hypothetical protein
VNAVGGGTMGKEIKHYSRRVRRQVNNETRTRHITVEEYSDGIFLIVYEVRRTKDNDGRTIGYDLHPQMRKWYLTPEDGINAAETVFDSNVNSGFREIVAGKSAGR